MGAIVRPGRRVVVDSLLVLVTGRFGAAVVCVVVEPGFVRVVDVAGGGFVALVGGAVVGAAVVGEVDGAVVVGGAVVGTAVVGGATVVGGSVVVSRKAATVVVVWTSVMVVGSTLGSEDVVVS